MRCCLGNDLNPKIDKQKMSHDIFTVPVMVNLSFSSSHSIGNHLKRLNSQDRSMTFSVHGGRGCIIMSAYLPALPVCMDLYVPSRLIS